MGGGFHLATCRPSFASPRPEGHQLAKASHKTRRGHKSRITSEDRPGFLTYRSYREQNEIEVSRSVAGKLRRWPRTEKNLVLAHDAVQPRQAPRRSDAPPHDALPSPTALGAGLIAQTDGPRARPPRHDLYSQRVADAFARVATPSPGWERRART